MAFRRPHGTVTTFDAETSTPPRQETSLLRASIQQLADSNIVGMLFTKKDGTILEANQEFLRMIGYSRADLEAGRLNSLHLTPSDWGMASRHAAKQLEETGKALPFEKEYLRKDGTRVPVLVGIVQLPPPDCERLGFVVDQSPRKQAEKDLDRLITERFAMLDSVGDGIYGLDLEGRCTFVNAAAAQMLGYTPQECHGRNMHDLIHSKRPDGSPYPVESCPIFDTMRKCEGMRVDDEAVWRKDGTSLAVEYASYPIVLNGRLEGCVVSFKDISKRKKAEEELRVSEERFRGAFANASAGMCITDLQGRFLEVNPAFCRFTGYSEAELLVNDFQTITHPADLEMSIGFLGRLARKEIPGLVAEKRYIRKDGGIAWARCSIAVQCDRSGAPSRLVSIVEDITERVTAELNLRRSEARYRCIVENTQEGICMCDSGRNIVYRNRRLITMLGYPENNACFDCDGIHFEDDREEAHRRFALRQQGASECYETRLRRADGAPLWVNASASSIPDERGRFSGSVCMFTDITAHKHLEDRLRQVQKMEALGQLAGGIAHDFNNLLTVILGYGDVLEKKLACEDPLFNNVVEIKKAGERAAALTQKLLAFSRKQVLRPRLIPLNHLIRDMEAMLRRLIGDQVGLRTALDPAVGNIQADPGQIEQVILNLAINARDAMPKGGRLLIESKRQDLDLAAAQARSLAPGSYALVTFTDNGCGMDAETKDRIFEPFFTTKELGAGTGLGLSTVLDIVTQSGGAISVDSEVNAGTTFKIRFPLVEEAVSQPLATESAAAQPAGDVILVVEDDDSIRRLAREVLEEHGYRVLEAACAEEAITVAGRSPAIDLLLTDIVMKGMNGHELANRLLAIRPGTKVLDMSGYAESGAIQQDTLEPGRNILSKPFQPREILAKVVEILATGPASAKILVVDDDVQELSFLVTLLEAEGYRVLQASNGKEARAICMQSLPDLVITDLVMPEQEGLETIHAICREWPHLPVIAVSGALGGAYLELASKMGADAVLRKPFQPCEVLSQVRHLIRK